MMKNCEKLIQTHICTKHKRSIFTKFFFLDFFIRLHFFHWWCLCAQVGFECFFLNMIFFNQPLQYTQHIHIYEMVNTTYFFGIVFKLLCVFKTKQRQRVATAITTTTSKKNCYKTNSTNTYIHMFTTDGYTDTFIAI